LCSGIYHYQYKIVTKSWFEPVPTPALPDNTHDENAQIPKEATFTEVWYTFVDPMQLKLMNVVLTMHFVQWNSYF